MNEKVSLETLLARLRCYGFYIDRTEEFENSKRGRYKFIWLKGEPGTICITVEKGDYEVSGFMEEGYSLYDYV